MQPPTKANWLAIASRRGLIAVLLCCGWLNCSAELPFTFRVWTTHQGLPENQVTCLLQTRDGYLWVGTEDGLARFDGVRFVSFGLKDGLRSTRIHALHEDQEGTLWIGAIAGGVSRLRNGKIEALGEKSGQRSLNIRQIADDPSGRVWAAGSGLAYWENGRFIPVAMPKELQSTSINQLTRCRSGLFWLAAYGAGLWRFDGTNFSQVTGPDVPEEITGTCHRIWEDHAGRLWVCAGANKLFCHETSGWRLFSIPLDTSLPLLRSLAEEPNGTIWAGSIRNGLYYVEAGQLNRITTADGLSENGVESLLVDREGNIWVGTIGGGLNRLSRKKVRAYGQAEGLRYPVVRGITEISPNELWVSTRGDGLYNWQNGSFQRVQFGDPLDGEVFFNSLVQAKDGSRWAATGHGIVQFKNGRRVANPNRDGRFQNTANVALWPDREDGVWAGASQSLWHLREAGDELISVCNPRQPIISIAQERNGAIWVGTEGDGLYRTIGNDVRHFTQRDGLGSDQVRALHFDREGTLWIGTASGGLTRLKQGRFFTVGTKDGLPDDTISQILENDSRYLWIGCNRGIARLHKDEIEQLANGKRGSLFPTVLTASDGLPSEECTGTYSPAGLKLASGELCFATLRGIVLIDPKQEWQSSPPPQVWLEEVLVDGKIWQMHAGKDRKDSTNSTPLLQGITPIILPPGSHRLELHYAGLNFTAPDQVRFRYKLEGLDPDWVPAGGERTAHYNYIPPGAYTFHVIACNKDGVWNETGARLPLTVQAFFWQRGWFAPAAVLMTVFLAAMTIRSVERQRQRRAQERLEAAHAIERERTRIAKDIHDDLGATLSEIRMLSTFAQSPESPQERVREDLKQIATRALDSTQALDEIVWAVNPKADTLDSLVNYACSFATGFLTMADIRCRLDLSADTPRHALRADVRYNLFLAFKEALTNVIKHSHASEVRIRVEVTSHTATISVTDNGKGMPMHVTVNNSAKDSTEGHDGLANMQSRLASVGGQCEFSSGAGEGTTVRFRIPLRSS